MSRLNQFASETLFTVYQSATSSHLLPQKLSKFRGSKVISHFYRLLDSYQSGLLLVGTSKLHISVCLSMT